MLLRICLLIAAAWSLVACGKNTAPSGVETVVTTPAAAPVASFLTVFPRELVCVAGESRELTPEQIYVSDKKPQYITSYKPFEVSWSAPGSDDTSRISLEPGADGEFLLLDEGSEHPWKTFAGARITELRQMSARPAEGLRVSLRTVAFNLVEKVGSQEASTPYRCVWKFNNESEPDYIESSLALLKERKASGLTRSPRGPLDWTEAARTPEDKPLPFGDVRCVAQGTDALEKDPHKESSRDILLKVFKNGIRFATARELRARGTSHSHLYIGTFADGSPAEGARYSIAVPPRPHDYSENSGPDAEFPATHLRFTSRQVGSYIYVSPWMEAGRYYKREHVSLYELHFESETDAPGAVYHCQTYELAAADETALSAAQEDFLRKQAEQAKAERAADPNARIVDRVEALGGNCVTIAQHLETHRRRALSSGDWSGFQETLGRGMEYGCQP